MDPNRQVKPLSIAGSLLAWAIFPTHGGGSSPPSPSLPSGAASTTALRTVWDRGTGLLGRIPPDPRCRGLTRSGGSEQTAVFLAALAGGTAVGERGGVGVQSSVASRQSFGHPAGVLPRCYSAVRVGNLYGVCIAMYRSRHAHTLRFISTDLPCGGPVRETDGGYGALLGALQSRQPPGHCPREFKLGHNSRGLRDLPPLR